MASIASPPLTKGISSSTKHSELAIPLQNAGPGASIHLHLTLHAKTIQLFVTTTSNGLEDGGAQQTPDRLSSLGSFVYAMPDTRRPGTAISTTLYTGPTTTLDFATRLAKILALKTRRAVHVGSSACFTDCVNGGTVEEETDAFRRVVGVVLEQCA